MTDFHPQHEDGILSRVLRIRAGVLASLVIAALGTAGISRAATLPDLDAIAPLRRTGRIERHTPDNLWERIDGAAELYRSYGLLSSEHAIYEDPGNPDRRVDLSVFTMREPIAAFGLYATFQRAGCPVQSIGNGGCVEDYQGFFWSGQQFVLADASGPEATRGGDLHRALVAASGARDPAAEPPEFLATFLRHVDAVTVRYRPRHLLDTVALPPGIEGTGNGVTYFRTTPALDVDAVLAKAGKMLVGLTPSTRGGYRVLAGNVPGLGPLLIVASPAGIAGALATPDAPGIWERLTRLLPPGGSGVPPGR